MRSAIAAILICVLAGPAFADGDDWGMGQSAAFQGLGELVMSLRKADDMISSWPEDSELLARRIMHEYGRPDEAGPLELAWNYRKPFARILVFRDAQSGQPGLLLEAVPYDFPAEQEAELAAFGHARYDRKLGELIAQADREPQALLALNLADDVARGRMTAEGARAFYDQALAAEAAGKLSPYMGGLLFSPASIMSPEPGKRKSDPAG